MKTSTVVVTLDRAPLGAAGDVSASSCPTISAAAHPQNGTTWNTAASGPILLSAPIVLLLP